MGTQSPRVAANGKLKLLQLKALEELQIFSKLKTLVKLLWLSLLVLVLTLILM
jgi:hypothetical protein